jgi:hypothetical protein
VLLLHITTASPDPPATFELGDRDRSTRRWWLHPPRAPGARAAVFTIADQILAAGSVEDAAATFMPWFDAIPPSWDGRVSWAADHTHADPTLTRILLAASTPRQRLSHRLPRETVLRLRPEWIPQRIPARLQDLVAGCGLSGATARGFASFCLAKAQDSAGSWADAATRLELPEQIGVDLARTASAHLTVSINDWIDRLHQVAQQLRAYRVDYRAREHLIRGLAPTAQAELLCALQDVRPGTRGSSRDLIWHWAWEHWAAGQPHESPTGVQTAHRGRVRYAQFRASLQPHHHDAIVGPITRLVPQPPAPSRR